MSFPTVPIGVAFEVRNGATPSSSESTFWDGDIPWVGPADLGKLENRHVEIGARSITKQGYESCGTQMVPAGSIILSTRAPIGHIAIAAQPMCFNQGCRGLVPRKIIDTDFAYWALVANTANLQAAGQGTTFVELARDKLRAERISLPDLPTQKAIVDFLDRETARIDLLIEKKQRFREMANERWQAALNHVVFPHSPDWERLPDGWRKVQLKYLTDPKRPIMYGIVLPGPNMEEGPVIVKGGDVKPGRLHPDRLCRTTHEIEASYVRSRLKSGDLVISIRGGIGDIEIVPPEIDGANLTQDAARIAPRQGIDREWLRYALLSSAVFHPLESRSLGAAVRGINIFDLKRVFIPEPPPAQQTEIARKLASMENRLTELRELVKTHADRLREFRAALITAAVSGQIDPETWSRRGTTDRRLDQIEAEMGA